MLGIIFIILFLIFMIIISIDSFLSEKHNFNNGYCIKCGESLYCFDIDSQGSRGYNCTNCEYSIWISHKSIDNFNKKGVNINA